MPARLCEDSGVRPIFLTPMPRDANSMSPIQIEPWQELRQAILDMKSTGAIVLDASALLGHSTDGELDGTYMANMSGDGLHPNDMGHSAIAAALVMLLQDVCE